MVLTWTPRERRFGFLHALGLAGVTALLVARFVPVARLPFWHCVIREHTGWPCPGCGLTRALEGLAHGRFGFAFGSNPLGALGGCLLAAAALVAAVQVVFRLSSPGARALGAGGSASAGWRSSARCWPTTPSSSSRPVPGGDDRRGGGAGGAGLPLGERSLRPAGGPRAEGRRRPRAGQRQHRGHQRRARRRAGGGGGGAGARCAEGRASGLARPGHRSGLRAAGLGRAGGVCRPRRAGVARVPWRQGRGHGTGGSGSAGALGRGGRSADLRAGVRPLPGQLGRLTSRGRGRGGGGLALARGRRARPRGSPRRCSACCSGRTGETSGASSVASSREV